MIQGYETADPPERHQKALPVRIFKALWRSRSSELDLAIGQLTVGAFFFAMRSCEYVSVEEKGKTQGLRLSDIQFFAGNRLVQKSDPLLYEKSTTVTVTFRNQKNGDSFSIQNNGGTMSGESLCGYCKKNPVL